MTPSAKLKQLWDARIAEYVKENASLTARLAAAEALAAKRFSDIERLESELEQSRKLFKTATEGFIRRTRERDAAMRVARDYKDKYDAAKETE